MHVDVTEVTIPCFLKIKNRQKCGWILKKDKDEWKKAYQNVHNYNYAYMH